MPHSTAGHAANAHLARTSTSDPGTAGALTRVTDRCNRMRGEHRCLGSTTPRVGSHLGCGAPDGGSLDARTLAGPTRQPHPTPAEAARGQAAEARVCVSVASARRSVSSSGIRGSGPSCSRRRTTPRSSLAGLYHAPRTCPGSEADDAWPCGLVGLRHWSPASSVEIRRSRTAGQTASRKASSTWSNANSGRLPRLTHDDRGVFAGNRRS